MICDINVRLRGLVRKGGTEGGVLVHPKGETSMANLLPRGIYVALHQQLSLVLKTTECNLVCSLEQEYPREMYVEYDLMSMAGALCMHSIHSRPIVFIAGPQ